MKAIVIGATSGMGREIARQMISAGWQIGIAGRRTELLEELQKEGADATGIAPQVRIQTLDVLSEEAPERLKELISKLGGMDVFMMCSGVGAQNPQLDLKVEMPVLQTNVIGFTRMIDTAFNYFRTAGGGQIALISSIAGTKGLGVATAYSASKRFQNHYIDALEQLSYMQKLNISFTDIRPGFVNTALLKNAETYPMLLTPEFVARKAFRAIIRHRRVAVIDWRYSIMVFFWGLLPRCIWKRMKISNSAI